MIIRSASKASGMYLRISPCPAVEMKRLYSFSICDYAEKIALIVTLLNDNANKTVVLLATSQQVKFLHRLLVTVMKLEIRVFAVWGRPTHAVRTWRRIAKKFKKKGAVLLTTGPCSEGLDFSKVGRVIYADCPPDAQTIIRTFRRFPEGVHSIQFLIHSYEQNTLKQLQKHEVNMHPLWTTNELERSGGDDKMGVLRTAVNQDPALADLARAAYFSYIKYHYFMKKNQHNGFAAFDRDAYARFLGLDAAPECPLSRRATRNQNRKRHRCST